MNGSSKRPPHGRCDSVGHDDATVRALITESKDLTRQTSGLAANSRTIDGSHTEHLKHERPNEKAGFVRSAGTNRTGGNDDTNTRTAATGRRDRSLASKRRTAKGLRLSTSRLGEVPSPLALQLLVAWRRVPFQPESVHRQGDHRQN